MWCLCLEDREDVWNANLNHDLKLVKDGPTNIVNGHLKGAMSVLNANGEGLDDTGAFLERVRVPVTQPKTTEPREKKKTPFTPPPSGLTHYLWVSRH